MRKDVEAPDSIITEAIIDIWKSYNVIGYGIAPPPVSKV